MKNKWLIIIAISAVLIRFISLSSFPPSLNRDEAAIGYNAYSILKTARDEHGQYLPLAFKSIGDYKMPLYIYLTTIPIKLFGLNDFSIRFWSALAGVVSVVAVYYLTKELTKKPKAAILASALLTFNPWAIFYSRIGFEANLALAFFLVGLCLINRGLKQKSWFFFGLITFLLAFLTYSSSLIFIPLFLAIFLFFNRSKLKKPHFIFLIIFVVFGLTIFKSLWAISSQKSSITIFSDPATIDYYNQTRTAIYQVNPVLARTWWNKYVFFTRIATKNYLKTFTPKFLLTQGGGHPWHQIPGVGNFYYLEIFFAIIGLFWLIKSKHKNLKAILLAWLLLAPLPSAITIDAPHSTRTLHLLPIILILASLGVTAIRKKFKLKKSLLVLIFALYFINLSYAGYRYLITYPKNLPRQIPVGLKESLQFIKNKNLTGQTFLTNIHDSTYLYPLIYTQFDPVTFQTQATWTQPDPAGLINAYQFGKFTIVDDLKDIKDPAVVILPQGQLFSNNQSGIIYGNYQVYLIKE